MNIYVASLLGMMVIVLSWFLYEKSKSYKHLAIQKRLVVEELEKLEGKLRREEMAVDQHREELLAQTEYLKELNEELERLSLVASKTDNSVMIADAGGRFSWVNEGFVKLHGYSLEEFIRNVGKDIFSVSTNVNIRPMIKKSIEDRTSLNYTSFVHTRSGEVKWVKTTINPIFDNEGRLKSFIILDTDVTELKIINDKLRKLSLVASKTNNSVAIFDENDELDWVNEGFHRMYGYSRQEFLKLFGVTLESFFAYNNKKDILSDWGKERTAVSFVNSIRDRFDIVKWKQASINPVPHGNDKYHTIIVETDITRIKEAEALMLEEKRKADTLLLNILPEETAEELKSKGKAVPRLYRSVSVLFADIVDFTKLAENLTPNELVHDLQTYFSRFDDAVNQYYVEKIKTIGDAFLCVGGIPMKNKSHPFDTVLLGLELQRIIKQLAAEREETGRRPWSLRVGIHTGNVIAGVVGKQKMTYDIWGDSVNIAKRIESACVQGMVNISGTTYEIIKDYFECEHRGKILAKHKGHIDMYFVHRIRPEYSVNRDGITPNNLFNEMLASL